MVAPVIVGIGFVLMLRVRSDRGHIIADQKMDATT